MTTEALPVDEETTGTHHHRETSPGGRIVLGEPVRRLVVLAIAFFAIAASLSFASSHRAGALSLLDEPTHADYAYELAYGHIPRAGSPLSKEILKEWACRGAPAGITLPPCGQPDPQFSQFPNAGQNYNYGHPPLYYAITGLLARAGDAVVSGPHFIAFGRAVGVGWLFAAMLVFYLAVRRFGVRWPYAAAGAVLLPLCPGILQAASTITNDAPAALCGAAALFLFAGLLRTGRIGWIAPVVVTVLATATKVLNGLPMLLMAVVLVVLAIGRHRAGDPPAARRLLLTAVAIGVSFVVVFKGWALIQGVRAQDGWVNPILGQTGRPVKGVPFNELISPLFSGFQLVGGYYLPPQLNGESVTMWIALLSALIIAAPFVGLAGLPSRSPGWVIALTTLGGILAYPIIVELQVLVESDLYFPNVTPRYGMTLLPFAIACLAFVAHRRGWLRTTWLVTGLGLVVMLLGETGITTLGPVPR
jgi:hypothetical protein